MRLILPTLLLALVLPATAAADERTLTTVTPAVRSDRAAPSFPVVDAYAGRVVWSDYDAGADVWRLMEHVSGLVRAVPVPPRSTPFDVDLGPDGSGGTVAVYSRCARRLPHDEPAPPQNAGRRYGCDLYAYSFATGRERELSRASSGGDEAWPAVWGSRLAFVRTYPDRAGRRGRTPYLYWRRLDRRGASERLRRPSSAIEVRTSTPRGRRTRRVFLPYEISGLDMHAGKVAYAWDRHNDASSESFVWLATTGGSLRPAADGATTGGGAAVIVRSVSQPAVMRDRVHWLFVNHDEPSYFASFLRRSGGDTVASARANAAAFAHGGTSAFWVDRDTFELKADDSRRYGRVPRSWLPVEPPG
jgi:hypothetical protein